VKLKDLAKDAASNMTSRVVEADGQPTVTETRTYNDLNQITGNQVVVSGGPTTNWTFAHDANGNMLTKSDGTNTWHYQWNDENRLVLVTLPGGATVGYTWDMIGRLLTRTDSTGTTMFVWDGFNCVQETDSADNVTRYVIPVLGPDYGRIVSFDRNGVAYQAHWDALGSIRLVTDESGTVVARFDSDAWGNASASAFDSVPDGGCLYRFVGSKGCRWDPATGLYYMRQRWYDPTLCRFISRDPFALTSRYTYCGSKPQLLTDPTGSMIRVTGTPDAQAGFENMLSNCTGLSTSIDSSGTLSVSNPGWGPPNPDALWGPPNPFGGTTPPPGYPTRAAVINPFASFLTTASGTAGSASPFGGIENVNLVSGNNQVSFGASFYGSQTIDVADFQAMYGYQGKNPGGLTSRYSMIIACANLYHELYEGWLLAHTTNPCWNPSVNALQNSGQGLSGNPAWAAAHNAALQAETGYFTASGVGWGPRQYAKPGGVPTDVYTGGGGTTFGVQYDNSSGTIVPNFVVFGP
jgi:RHS repeat-associated protein